MSNASQPAAPHFTRGIYISWPTFRRLCPALFKGSERLVKCIVMYFRGQVGHPDTFSAHPCYSYSHKACTDSLSTNLIKTCRFMPSILIMLTVFSWIRRASWSHSSISYAVMRELDGSKEQTTVFCRSAITARS
jgi:hypothetical protein